VRTSRLLRAIVVGAVAILLAWLVLSKSLVAYLAAGAPEAALWLDASDPEALLSLAHKHLDTAEGDTTRSDAPAPPGERLRLWSELAKAVAEARHGNDGGKAPPSSEPPSPVAAAQPMRDRVRIWVEAALVSDPLNARALRMLGQLAQAAGEESRTRSYMQAAAHRSIQESLAVDWLMRHHHRKKNYAAAIHFADALLRTRSQVMEHVLPILGSMAGTPAARGELEKVLAGNPPWRRSFLSALPRAVSDARTPLVVFLTLRGAANPPTAADIRDYVSVLVQHKFYELAYYTWLQFLPPERVGSAGLLFNGSFEFPPSGLPFDWVVHAGTGVTVDIVERPDDAGQRALYLELGPGRVEFGGVAQTLLLPPGPYRLRGKFRGEITGRRGLVWRIACVGASGPLGQSPTLVGVSAHWKDFEFAFAVPAAECRAQHLRLELDARMASEQLVSGSVWYDELTISRGG
jgi:hypothetical protein